MKKLVVLTGTRADFGLLSPIIKKLMAFTDIDVRVVATGTHLSPEFGMTVSEIESDGILVDRKISILLSSDAPSAKKEKQSVYVSPMVETIEIKSRAMLCQSQSPSTVNNPFGNTNEEEI